MLYIDVLINSYVFLDLAALYLDNYLPVFNYGAMFSITVYMEKYLSSKHSLALGLFNGSASSILFKRVKPINKYKFISKFNLHSGVIYYNFG